MGKQRERSILFAKKIKRKLFGYYTETSTKRAVSRACLGRRWPHENQHEKKKEGGKQDQRDGKGFHSQGGRASNRKAAATLTLASMMQSFPRRKSKHDAVIHQYLPSLYPRRFGTVQGEWASAMEAG
jgi:hypothetical protein